MIAQSLRRAAYWLLVLHAAPGAAEGLSLGPGFTLAAGQDRYVLSGVVPPTADEAQRREAEAWLAKTLGAHDWTLRPYGQPDRYGRRALSAKREDGSDLAESMLSAGEALADSGIPAESWLSRLIAAEAPARAAQRGIWRHPPIFASDRAGDAVGRYALIDGTIDQVSEHKGSLYLDFGPDGKTAATAWVPPRFASRFSAELRAGLPHRQVELRGWVEAKDGAGGPARIVLLSPAALKMLP